jgi:hypothetical protein
MPFNYRASPNEILQVIEKNGTGLLTQKSKRI